ncbi:hypothetical protein [uncultured Winogradskyella sp.]|uniref:hypothetical protein n=1 Tax=uncultured Winogradskyella sp. TaxID=395353 RepID=UPI002636023E|nr:hypothetical protein [uncultured Winogradskyella sp.]|tara:strand:+ start:409 stop:633 length:225 start_codon:yes stop_codon:yes gene_type:complete
MKDLHNMLKEITELTTDIETNYPELYRSLEEIPMTIPTNENPNVDKVVMQDYLESLKQLLEHYLKEEKVRVSKP